MENGTKIYSSSTKISRIAAELLENVPSEKHNDAFQATKELMGQMKLNSLTRDKKMKLARERIRSGFYHRKDVMAKIANEILKEFDLA